MVVKKASWAVLVAEVATAAVTKAYIYGIGLPHLTVITTREY